jgi:hypothetical protein
MSEKSIEELLQEQNDLLREQITIARGKSAARYSAAIEEANKEALRFSFIKWLMRGGM